MFLVSSCSCLCPIYWSIVLCWEWRCSWSSADRRCSNYIWVINNLIAHKGATYIYDGGHCRKVPVYQLDQTVKFDHQPPQSTWTLAQTLDNVRTRGRRSRWSMVLCFSGCLQTRPDSDSWQETASTPWPIAWCYEHHGTSHCSDCGGNDSVNQNYDDDTYTIMLCHWWVRDWIYGRWKCKVHVLKSELVILKWSNLSNVRRPHRSTV